MTLFRPPRLLPVTMAAMVLLLGVKCAGLVSEASAESGTAGPATAAAAPEPAPSAGKLTAEPSPAPAPPAPAPAEQQSDEELRRRRDEAKAQEAALRERQSVLAATEQKLEQRVAELKALQAKLEQMQSAGAQKQEQDLAGLVQLYEKMKPRDAARILEGMETPVLVPLIARMKEIKAAPILAAMRPDRAREVTAELAARHPDPAAPAPDAK